MFKNRPHDVSRSRPVDVAATDHCAVTKSKFFTISTAVAFSLVGQAGATPFCVGTKTIPPIYLYQASDKSLFTFDVITPPLAGYAASIGSVRSNSYDIQKRGVDVGEARKLCELGFSVSLQNIDLTAPRSAATRRADQRKFEPVSDLPTSFTIEPRTHQNMDRTRTAISGFLPQCSDKLPDYGSWRCIFRWWPPCLAGAELVFELHRCCVGHLLSRPD